MSKIQFIMSEYLNQTSQPPIENKQEQEFPIKMISVYDLIPNPLNFYELSDIEKLETEIELQGGIMTNLEVKAVENGKYMIIAGHRRRQAMINLLEGKSDKITSDKVPCTIKTYESQEDELKALSLSNRSQRKKTPTEELKELQALKPILSREFKEKKARGIESGRLVEYMARYFEVSPSTIQRIENRAKLDDEIKEKLDTGEITPTAATQLTGLSAADQKAVYEDTVKQGMATVKAIEEKKKEYIVLEPVKPAELKLSEALSETEIKIIALTKNRDVIIKEIEKIPVNDEDIGRVSVNGARLACWILLKQVITNELENLSGNNIFEEAEHE